MKTIKAKDAVIGGWYENGGHRVIVLTLDRDGWMTVATQATIAGGGWHVVVQSIKSDEELTPLPDCDSWTWQPPTPIDPGKGWRWLERKEIVQQGDELTIDGGYYVAALSTLGQAVDQIESERPTYVRRRIEPPKPRYRPFVNAEEFKPHRNRWIRFTDGKSLVRCEAYNEIGCNTCSWKWWFENAVFDDTDEPVGVRVE